MKRYFFSFFLAMTILPGIAQNYPRFFGQWGWNRDWYTKSDLSIRGSDYDLTLHQIKAHDRQSPFGLDPYLNPAEITVPQTNLRIGVRLNEKWGIAAGFDHMKYVMDNDQVVKVDGTIDRYGNSFSREYQNEDVMLTEDFLRFEHTDGLNYIHVELERFVPVDITTKSKKMYAFDWSLTAGFGMLRPRSDVYILGVKGPNEFHVSGFGLHLGVGTSRVFGKHFLVEAKVASGYINMPNIETTSDPNDRASQQFMFLQPRLLFGYIH